VSSGGAKANQPADDPGIDADGTHVTFLSQATNLGAPTAGTLQVWVRDTIASKTVLASRAGGANGAPGVKSSSDPALSADGHVVAFASGSANLAGGPGGSQVFRRDLDALTTQLVSRGAGPAGEDVRFGGGITADGACVAFTAPGNLLGTLPGSLDYLQAYMRVFKADCGGRSAKGFSANDTTAPVLRSVKLSRKRFRVAKARTPLVAAAKAHRGRPARGTVLRFKSSEAAKLTVVVERLPAGHSHRKARKLATLTRGIRAGTGHVGLSGRLGKRRMAAGRYRLTITARDLAGNKSKPVRLTFTVLAG
jgi:hypothetical protein